MPRRRRNRRSGWAKTTRVLAGGKRFGKAFVKSFATPVLATLAKRFITSIAVAGAPLVTTAAARQKVDLSMIPRNITSIDSQVNNRVGNKVFIKGISLMGLASAIVGAPQQFIRIILTRQSDPADNIELTDVYAPTGTTNGIRVLMDKAYRLDVASANNGNDGKVIKRYVSVNAPLLFNGTALTGTDRDEGTCVLYLFSDNAATGFNFVGSSTLHYREML